MRTNLLAFDPRLPHRDALLDAAVIARRLPALLGVGAGAPIGAAKRIRTKYRVGESLRVLHRIPIGGTVDLVSTRMATRERIARLATAIDDGSRPISGRRAVVHDGELDTVSWVFPRDRKLASLPELLWAGSPLRGELGLDSLETSVAAYVPEKSVTLRCHDGHRRIVAYVKMYAEPEAAAASAERSDRIAAPATAAGVGLPRVVAFLPAHRVVVMDALPGLRLDRLARADRLDGLWALGRALAFLHELPAGAESELERFRPDELHVAADLLARSRPDVSRQAATLAELLAARGPFPGRALLHGDVHLKNGLFAGGQVHLVDLDQCARGHPAADVGSLVAALRHRRLVDGLDVADLADLEAAFLAGYVEHAELDEDSVRWHTAASLLVERAVRAVHRVLPETLVRLPALLLEAEGLLTGSDRVLADRRHTRRVG